MSAEAFSHSVKAFHRLRYVIVSDIILSERKHNSMNGLLWAAAGTGFTFSMTTLGAAVVFFMRKEGQSEKVQKAFLGFAAGVMIAASVWSLLIPAINEAEALGRIAWIPAAGGFALGVLFLMGLDKAMPYFLPEPGREEGVRRGLKRSGMLIFAITLHNIPEGMAVGLAFALAAHNDSSVLLAFCFAPSPRCYRTCHRHGNTELSGGCGYRTAAEAIGHEQGESIRPWHSLRNC